MSYFIVYWKNGTWEKNRQLNEPGHLLDHTSGERLNASGVVPGDSIYVVTNKLGELYLGGKMTVGAFVDRATAARITGMPEDRLWYGSEHVVASGATPMNWNIKVPSPVVRKLEIMTSGGIKNPVFEATGRLDRQTFRGVRKITKDSAEVLDKFLKIVAPLEGFHRELLLVECS